MLDRRLAAELVSERARDLECGLLGARLATAIKRGTLAADVRDSLHVAALVRRLTGPTHIARVHWLCGFATRLARLAASTEAS